MTKNALNNNQIAKICLMKYVLCLIFKILFNINMQKFVIKMFVFQSVLS
jgi:hypothetical protein